MSDLVIAGIFIILIAMLTIGYNYIITKIVKKKYYNKIKKENKNEYN